MMQCYNNILLPITHPAEGLLFWGGCALEAWPPVLLEKKRCDLTTVPMPHAYVVVSRFAFYRSPFCKKIVLLSLLLLVLLVSAALRCTALHCTRSHHTYGLFRCVRLRSKWLEVLCTATLLGVGVDYQHRDSESPKKVVGGSGCVWEEEQRHMCMSVSVVPRARVRSSAIWMNLCTYASVHVQAHIFRPTFILLLHSS